MLVGLSVNRDSGLYWDTLIENHWIVEYNIFFLFRAYVWYLYFWTIFSRKLVLNFFGIVLYNNELSIKKTFA
jgi:hypothetical protein